MLNARKRTYARAKVDEMYGGMVTIECAIHSSKVNVVCPKCNKPTRIGYELDKDGKKVRVCKK